MRSAIPPVHDSPASKRPPDGGSVLGSMALVLLALAAIAIGGPVLSAAIAALGSVVGDPTALVALAAVVAFVAVALRSRRSLARRLVRRGSRSGSAWRAEEAGRPRR